MGLPPLVGGQSGELLRIEAQLRAGDDRSAGVRGHFDFRDEHDVEAGGVADQVADVLLRVETAEAGVGGGGRCGLHLGKVHPRADLRELGVFSDFDSPAAVVGQMDLEAIELVDGHGVQEVLDILHGDEMPRRVDQQPSPAEPRRIGDADAGDRPLSLFGFLWAEDGRREKLAKGLDGVEQTGGLIGPNANGLRRDL